MIRKGKKDNSRINIHKSLINSINKSPIWDINCSKHKLNIKAKSQILGSITNSNSPKHSSDNNKSPKTISNKLNNLLLNKNGLSFKPKTNKNHN